MKKLRLNIQLFGGSLSIVASETDVSVENNTSYINLQIKATTNSTTYNDSAYLKSATITGQNNTYTLGRINFSIGKGQTVTVYSGKIGPFNHNADGTLNPVSISASCYIVSNTQPSASTTVTMSTIPRASSIGVADANIGSSTNITINKNSQSFTTTLYYKASGQNSWTKIVDKTANQVYAWTVPTSFYALIPNSKTISCQFYADTYNGSTLVGSSSVVTATFTATGNPIINSCTLEATDSTTINLVGSNRMIRYISTIKATVSASGQNSATISSIKVNGVTASGGIATFTNASTYSYQVVVTDSRGYQTSGTYAITWTDYIPLTLNATIVRNQPTDEKIKISYSGNYYNSSFRTSSDQYIANTLSVQYRYREKNGTWGSWTNLSPTTSGNTYSQSNYIISGFDYQKQYEFDIKAIDRVSTKSITGIAISKGQPVYWWNDDTFTIPYNINLIAGGMLMNNLNGTRRDSANANDLSSTGNYYLGTNASNTPSNYFGMTTIRGGTTDITQFGISVVSSTAYIRTKPGQSWTNWKMLVGIEESGSNTNGNYVKYSDGTLIQWNDLSVQDQAMNNAYGSLYQGTRTITFPIEFKDTDYSAQCSQFQWGNGASWGAVVTRTSKSQMLIRGFDAFSRATGTTCNISWFAIGRWK